MDSSRRDALRLLTVINETQAHGHIGTTVIPSDAAEEAGLLSPSPTESVFQGEYQDKYQDALYYLVDAGALVPPEGSYGIHLKGWAPDAYGAQCSYTEIAQEMLLEG